MKDIPGYEGRYAVSEDGRVWSYSKYQGRGGRFLLEDLSRSYPSVTLHKDGSSKHFVIHRIVAVAYLPNPLNLPEVNHKDGNHMNYGISNLEWCTAKENKEHAAKNFLTAVGERNSHAKLTTAQILKIRQRYKEHRTPHRTLAKEYGMGKSMISYIINGTNWKHLK